MIAAAADHDIPHDNNELDSDYEEYSSDEETESIAQAYTKLNDESLQQLKNNDPKLTKLITNGWKESSYEHRVDWKNDVGTFEGNNNLKKLYIDFAREHGTANDDPLCDNAAALGNKISCIRSVENLNITDIGEYDDKVFASLAPLFEKSSKLIRIDLADCHFSTASTRLLASALSKQLNKGSLKEFSLWDAYFGEGEDSAELITALGGYHCLKNLYIKDGGFQGREHTVGTRLW